MSRSDEDFYELLGVERNASAEEIKKKYKRLAMKCHPDRNPGDKKAEENFKNIKKAYEVLSDSQKRAAYDRYGHAGIEGAASGAGSYGGASGYQDASSIFGDIFGDIFGGSSQGNSQKSHSGADIGYELSINLEEAVQGVSKKITVPTWASCKPCKGSGAREGSRAESCKTCGGRGTVQMHHGFIAVQQTCGECRGKGQTIRHPCGGCHGKGRVRDRVVVSVEVPPGVSSGDCLRFSGKGEAGLNGASAGDLIVQIEVKKHPIFTRKHNDLHVELPISFTTAALGGEIQVPTMGGTVKLAIPIETQNGRTFRLRGKGIKSLRGGSTGDLLCKVIVETPIKLNEEQKTCLEKFYALLEADGKDHSPRSRSWFDAVKRFFS